MCACEKERQREKDSKVKLLTDERDNRNIYSQITAGWGSWHFKCIRAHKAQLRAVVHAQENTQFIMHAENVLVPKQAGGF